MAELFQSSNGVIIDLFVPGMPQPGGSKKAFLHKRTGRAMIVDANPKSREWKNDVQYHARRAYAAQPVDVPLALDVIFYTTRPAGHYGTGRNAGQLKPTANPFPAVRPDCTKLLRSTEDALTGIVWRDDSLIVDQHAKKRYGSNPGARIIVKRMEGVM